MHAIEKILAKNSGRTHVKTGEIITAKIDFAEINDLYLQTIYSFYEMGGEKVWDNTRAAFVFDHYAPAPYHDPRCIWRHGHGLRRNGYGHDPDDGGTVVPGSGDNRGTSGRPGAQGSISKGRHP